MSRKRRFKPETVAAKLREAEGDVTAAAKALRCDRSTVHDYRKEFEVVRKAYDEFRPVMLGLAKSNIIRILRDPDHPKNYDASKFVLETQGREEGFTTRQEVAGVGGQPITVIFEPATDA